MPPTNNAPLADAERDALKHAWDWFSLHANQRMQAVNYFLIAFALILAGYGAALQASNHVIAVGLALTGMAISTCFLLLELRTRELVQAAEPALASLQARLAMRSETPELNIVASVENPTRRFRKYSFVIRALMCAATAVMALAALAAGVDAFHGSDQDARPTWPPGHQRMHH